MTLPTITTRSIIEIVIDPLTNFNMENFFRAVFFLMSNIIVEQEKPLRQARLSAIISISLPCIELTPI